jgi:polysaccharide pyruvyl transferase WcaK-like protein
MGNTLSETISGSGLKVLHIASFSGNVGDNANHAGMRRILGQVLGKDITYTELEIRKAYQNYPYSDKLVFNNSFVELANKYDLILIGGGGFFTIEIEQSQTGTTIDMGKDILDKITTPLIFHGVGCDHDPINGAPKHLVKRFRSFIDTAIEKENCLVSVRNDGSSDILKRYFGSRYIDSVYTIPDGGFLSKAHSQYHPELPISDKGKVIGINLAKDMMNYRFQFGSINYDQFIQGLKGVITNKLHEDPELSIVLIPHIYSDLETVSDLFRSMEDPLRRNRITVSPYIQGERGICTGSIQKL